MQPGRALMRLPRPGLPLLTIGAIMLVCFVYPLARFLALPVHPALAPLATLGAMQGSSGLSLTAMWNTARMSTEAALLVIPPGLAAGYLIERRLWRGRRVLALALWGVLLMPSYLLTMGWQILMAAPMLDGGVLNRLFYGEAGIVFLLTVKGLPFAALTARAGWQTIGEDMQAAFRVHVVSPWRRSRLVLRLMLPVAAGIFLVQVLAASQDFGIAATLGAQAHLPLVIYAIYQDLSSVPVNFVHAALLSWSLVALALAALGAQAWFCRRSYTTLHGRQRRVAPRPCGPGLAIAAWLLVGVILAAGVVAPVLALGMQGLGQGIGQGIGQRIGETGGGGATEMLHALDAEDWRAILLSLRYSFVSAVFVVLLAAIVLGGRWHGERGGRAMARLMAWLTVGNMAVPGVILGAAYVIGFNGTMLPLYGTPALLIIAYIASHLPIAIRFLDVPFSRLHRSLGEAARVHGMPAPGRVERIYAPLLLQPLVWAWGMVFVTLFFELPLSEILYPAGSAPLGVRLLSLDDTLHYGAESRLALAAILVCLALAGGVMALCPRLLRSGPSPILSTTEH